eukprot:TRINITY_DN6322_c0_g1_i1.p1 TRINITY_DN6322_c0_g1~~TRINITY_DN6322_c0_g1_i1.p1  ORF type:complete len:422 (+),score=92.16 TRINITY_DN6322_c0_g1_i1:3-1268(+)
MAVYGRLNYASFLSLASAAREPSPIRALMPLLQIPGMISLGGGMPNPSTFPFKTLETTLKDGTSLKLEGSDLGDALQYSASHGLPKLIAQLKTLQERTHRPVVSAASGDWDILVSTGSQDALAKAFEMLLDRGSTLLCEEPSYAGALAALRPRGIKTVGIRTDGQGLVPEALQQYLETHRGEARVLYVIPNGQNPAGSSLPLVRKQRIYQLAQQHNLIILEDDPYYFLHFDSPSPPPSLFQLDVDGRVLRFDSFSKVLSSGLRLGWVTGPTPLITRLMYDMQVTEMHTSGISQMLAARLLEHWGESGWKAHIASVQEFYRKRRDIFCGLLEKHLRGKCSWTVPSGGMFVWIRVHNVDDTAALIKSAAAKEKVLMLPGATFSASTTSPSPYVRCSYSTATEEQMEQALIRFASLLTSVQPKL